MRTPSILAFLLAVIVLISLQDRCQSEPAETGDRAELKTKGVSAVLHDMMILGAEDPKAAVLYALQQRKEGHEEIEFPTYFGRQWYKKSPKEFMQWAQSLTKAEFFEANECTLDVVEKSDSAEADEFVMHKMARGPKRNQAIFTIGFKKTNFDPCLAATWAESFAKNDPGRFFAIDSVAIFWSSKDAQAAIRWVNSISDNLPSETDSSWNENPSVAVWACLEALYKRSPSVALDWAIKNPNKGIRDIECYRITRKWAKANMEEPRKYISQISDRLLRLPLLVGYISESEDYPTSEFPSIADWMLSMEKSPFIIIKGDLFPLFLSTWIDKDRVGALMWLQKVPTHSQSEGTVKGNFVASLLAGENPFTSGRFLPPKKQATTNETSKENEVAPSFNFTKLDDEKVRPIMKPLYFEIRGDRASNIMLSVLVALSFFNGIKIWKLSRASFIPKSVRFGVGILSLCFLLSLPLGIYPLFLKENILTKVQVIYLGAYCFSMTLTTVCFWVIANQAARGSRVLFIIGLLFTLLGLVGVPVALLKTGNLPYALSCLLWGAPMLLCALRKTSREYRVQARINKVRIPKMFLFSIFSLFGSLAFYVVRDIYNLLETNRSMALQFAWMFPLGAIFYVAPFLWALGWGDKTTLNLYRSIIILFSAYVLGGLFVAFSDPSWIRIFINVLLSILFLSPAVFVFLPSVRSWAKDLKPAF